MEIIYKVVRLGDEGRRVSMGVTHKEPHESLLFPGTFIGKRQENPFCLTYPTTGERVIPHPPSRLLAFKLYGDAVEYAASRGGISRVFEIYEAVTEWVKPVTTVCATTEGVWLVRYWTGEETGTRSAPKGTVACPWIELRRIVWASNREIKIENANSPW